MGMHARKVIPTFNVFVDNKRGMQLRVFAFESAYDASAVANALYDDGKYSVYTDLWNMTIPDAMMRPGVIEMVRADFLSLGVTL